MRIIIVSQTYSAGNGQASFTIRLAEGLAERGHQVMVISPAETMRSYTCWQNGVRVEKVAALHLSALHPAIYFTPFPAARIKELYAEFKPELVHIQDHYFLSAVAVREARRQNISLLGTNHFLPENLLPFARKLPFLRGLLSAPLWMMMLAVFNRLDAATTPSETAAAILRGQRIRVPVRAISNGIDTNRFRPQPALDRAAVRRKYNLDPKRALFLYVGRLDGEKRLDVLLGAFARLKRDDMQLAIAGSGLYEKLLKKQMQTLGLEDRVTFIGFVSPEDLPSLYNAADIFVMPSPEELQSIATLEAMACGLPVLAADARALPELVKTGLNGYLFEAGNDRDAARCVEDFMQKRGMWSGMAQASFALAQPHSLENTLRQYEENYKALVETIRLKNRRAAARRKVYAGDLAD